MLRITILSLLLFFSSCTALRPKLLSRDRDITDIITSIPAEVKKLPVENRRQPIVESDPSLLDGFINSESAFLKLKEFNCYSLFYYNA